MKVCTIKACFSPHDHHLSFHIIKHQLLYSDSIMVDDMNHTALPVKHQFSCFLHCGSDRDMKQEDSSAMFNITQFYTLLFHAFMHYSGKKMMTAWICSPSVSNLSQIRLDDMITESGNHLRSCRFWTTRIKSPERKMPPRVSS